MYMISLDMEGRLFSKIGKSEVVAIEVYFFQYSIRFLGQIFFKEGIQTDPI